MPSQYPQGILESVVEAIGEELQAFGGQLLTCLATTILPTDTTITVDSTYRFPDQGTIRIGRERIGYDQKDDTHFYATSRTQGAPTYYRGRVVYDASRIVSEVDSARRQLDFDTAAGPYLRALIENHGLQVPAGLDDAALRAYGRFCAYVAAGPMRTVFDGLDRILNGQMRAGSVTGPNVLTLGAGVWPAVNRRLVRILAPSANAGVYRIRQITGLDAALEQFRGPIFDAATLTTEASVAFEILPFDLWEHPNEPCRFRVDLLKFGAFVGVTGATYLQGGEGAVSTDVTHVDVLWDVNNVLGVYLRTDVERAGTNYYEPGGSFLGKTLTLGTPLPAANTPVMVDYGAITTAQTLVGPQVDGKEYYPFYLSDPASLVSGIVDVIRAAGYLPIFTEVVV